MRELIAGFMDGLRPVGRLTVSEWADKYRILSTQEGSEPGPWRTRRAPYLKEIQDKLSATDPCREIVVMKGAQLGLALALDTPIPTPNGWATMGELKAGDVVFDENGKPCTVTFATEVMHDHKCYDVVFSDGSVITADEHHKWLVSNEKKWETRKDVVLFTREIAATFKHRNRNRYAINVCKPLDLPEADLIVPPYTLGAWLGDGDSSSNRITTHVDDAEEMLSYILEEGVSGYITSKNCKGKCVQIVLCKPDGYCSRGHLLADAGTMKRGRCYACHKIASARHQLPDVIYPKFGDLLKNAGVLRNKHIPPEYLRASIGQRLELLRGLMDTDGHVTKEGYCEWYSCDKRLTDDVAELIASLGMKPVVKVRKGGKLCKIYERREYISGDLYRITFQAMAELYVCNLQRKKSRIKPANMCRVGETTRRRIVDVREVQSVPMRCITVDSPSHLYLAGKNMIPTHNTQVGYNFVGYIIDNAPGPAMLVMPTLETAKLNSQTKFSPMIESTPKLREKIAPSRTRDSSNSTMRKEFPGGFIVMAGANSPTQLRSASIRYLILDEVDGYPLDADGEGSPIELAEARTRTFADKKIYKLSTPTVEGQSAIAAEFEKTDKRYYYVPCPNCGTFQTLQWKQVKFDREGDTVVPGSARYECEHCGYLIEERYKMSMLLNGDWRPTDPDKINPLRVGYHINSLYSTFGSYSWEFIAQEFIDTKDDPLKLKAFVNTILGETWKEPGEAPDWQNIYDRREAYERNRPTDEVAVITAGVDVQADRLELEIVGWMPGMRSMSLDYRVIPGDTSQPEVWEQLGRVVSETWARPDGLILPLSRMAVDSGYNTTAVYNFCRQYSITQVLPIKGFDTLGVVLAAPKQIDVNVVGKKVGQLKVWQVGSSVVKNEVYAYLRQRIDPETDKEPFGYCRFPEYGPEYFRGLTAEEKRFKIIRGVRVPEWHKVFERNEPLDCRVYARAAAEAVGVSKWSEDEFIAFVQGYQRKSQQAPKKRTADDDFWGGWD